MRTIHNRGKGKAYAWLVEHVGHQGEDCLIWPFCRDKNAGRGYVGHLGKRYWAHRLMCELAHGHAPTDKPQARHSCGSGHLGCVNPRHLSWDTNQANQLDRRKHGTHVSHTTGWVGKLTRDQRDQVRALKGKMPQWEIARMFGVSQGCINYWHTIREKRGVRDDYHGFTSEAARAAHAKRFG